MGIGEGFLGREALWHAGAATAPACAVQGLARLLVSQRSAYFRRMPPAGADPPSALPKNPLISCVRLVSKE